MKARDIFEDVARYLTDFNQEETESYVHWTQEDILSYFKYAVAIIAAANKEDFNSAVKVDLRPGALQDVPPSCPDLVDIVGVIEADGQLSSYTRKTATDFIRRFKLPYCRTETAYGAKYEMSSWGFLNGTTTQVLVDPPVPSGAKVTMLVTCFVQPTINTPDDDVPGLDRHKAAIFELMLYYAWGIDTESISSRERSAVHWANAMTLLGVGATRATKKGSTN